MKRYLIFIFTIACFFIMTGQALSQSNALNACVNAKGKIRLVLSPSECKVTETPTLWTLSWADDVIVESNNRYVVKCSNKYDCNCNASTITRDEAIAGFAACPHMFELEHAGIAYIPVGSNTSYKARCQANWTLDEPPPETSSVKCIIRPLKFWKQ
jgi:hypothetical protein